MTREEMIKALGAIYDGIANLRVEDDWVKEKWAAADALVRIIAALEAAPDGEPLAEGMGAEYGHTGVWMVWSGELGQLPWLQEPAVKARRVAIYGVDDA